MSAVATSVLTKNQVRVYGPKTYKDGDRTRWITVTVRYDDQCDNGHNTFSITAFGGRGTRGEMDCCGCMHEDVVKAFPELAPLIKFHLCSSDGPLHYISNTLYHAGDKDCHGLRKGERRQIVNGWSGKPCWTLVAVNAEGVAISETPTGDKYKNDETLPLFILDHDHTGELADAPPVPVLRWEPLWRVGEGKARELDHARSSAIWPEATDEELCAPDLQEKLEARLPALLAEFKAAVESLGFVY